MISGISLVRCNYNLESPLQALVQSVVEKCAGPYTILAYLAPLYATYDKGSEAQINRG